MNIDSANVLSALPAQTVTEGGSAPLQGTELPSSFAEAFIERLNLLSAGTSQGELLKPIPSISASPGLNELQSLSELLGEGGNLQKLAAFFGKELPVSYKLTDDVDLEATLTALTESLKFANPNETPATASQTLQIADQSETAAAIEAQNLQAMIELPVTETASVTVNNKVVTPENNQDSSEHGKACELAEALLASVLAPVTAPVEQSDGPVNSAESAAIKQQVSTPLMKNTVQNNHFSSTIADSDEGSDNILQKLADESNPGQNSKFAFNINNFEKTGFIDKNGQMDRDFTLGGEKNLLRGVPDMGQLNRHTVDARTEVPALVRPLAHPDWNKELGERILWMNNRSIPAAEIKLNPQHLGPISVRIDVNQDQATISFAAQHSTVREALEASIPRLRDMMNAQQLNLIDVNVSQHFSSDQGRSQPQNFAQTASSPNLDNADISAEAMEEIDNGRAVITKGLLSIYA